MSGLSHTPGKRARGYTLRGFESRLFRQRKVKASSPYKGLRLFSWALRSVPLRHHEKRPPEGSLLEISAKNDQFKATFLPAL